MRKVTGGEVSQREEGTSDPGGFSSTSLCPINYHPWRASNSRESPQIIAQQHQLRCESVISADMFPSHVFLQTACRERWRREKKGDKNTLKRWIPCRFRFSPLRSWCTCVEHTLPWWQGAERGEEEGRLTFGQKASSRPSHTCADQSRRRKLNGSSSSGSHKKQLLSPWWGDRSRVTSQANLTVFTVKRYMCTGSM